MSRCMCVTQDELCVLCEAIICELEEERAGRPAFGWTQTDLNRMADGAAADEFYGRSRP